MSRNSTRSNHCPPVPATTTTTTTNPKSSSSSSSSLKLFVPTFIPQHLLHINELPITTIFRSPHSHPNHNNNYFGPKQLLVPFVPICYCRSLFDEEKEKEENHHDDTTGTTTTTMMAIPQRQQHAASSSSSSSQPPPHSSTFTGERPLHTVPLRTMMTTIPTTRPNHHDHLDHYYYYAIQHRLQPQQSLGRHNHHHNHQNPIHHHHHSSRITTIMQNLDTYCQTWENIVQEEYLDVLLKYERFSQYSKSVTVMTTLSSVPPTTLHTHHNRNSNNTNTNTNQNNKNSNTMTAMISIRGIADASFPSLQIGDIVLLRPMHPISLPYPTPQHPQQQHPQPLANLSWTPPQNNIEIQTTILNVQRSQRSTFNMVDTVHISWCHPYESAMILYSIQHSSPSTAPSTTPNRRPSYHPQSNHHSLSHNNTSSSSNSSEANFNIRFVPSNTNYQRCCTALDWLRDSFVKKNSHANSANDNRRNNETKMNDYDSNSNYSYYSMTDDDDDDDDDDEEEKESHILINRQDENDDDKDNKSNKTERKPDANMSSSASAIMELLYPTTAPSDIIISAPDPSPLTFPTPPMSDPVDSIDSSINSTLHHMKKDLNHKQMSFVRMVQTRTQQPSYGSIRGPLILTGPAGTGKTKTALCALHAVLNDDSTNHTNRVLVCTPSHTASDVVTRRLGQYLSRQQLFRLYGSDRPLVTVPVEVLKYCYQNDDGTFGIPDVPILMTFQVIVCTCSDAHLLYRIGLTNQQLRIRRQCYASYIQKCCDGTNLHVQINGVQEPHFTHLFIDEAAQATEPETLIPLSVVVDPIGSHRKVEIALVGDPRQLSPSVHSIEAATLGLDRSWMERLLLRPVSCLGGGRDDLLGPDFVNIEDWLQYSLLNDGQDQLSFFLTLNYRGHPSFLMMPSALFYADKLHCVDRQITDTNWCAVIRHIENMSDPVIITPTATSVDVPDEVQCRKQFDWPIHFRGVVGNDVTITIEADFASNSWQNMAEAETIVAICLTLSGHGVTSDKIGVMSPYRGQVVLIRKLLRSKQLGGINVGTVEDYQSVEFDVILLSLVRSTLSFVQHDIQHRMGVFGQPKRSNVALTRAEFLFVVVGNPNVMVNDAIWQQFLFFCYRNGLYYGEQLDDTATLSWSNNVTDGGYKVVRSLNQLDNVTNDSTRQGVTNAEEVPSSSEGQQHIVISSLERYLRI